MPDQRVVNFEGKTQIFPGDATDAEISAALNAIPSSNAAAAPKAKTWSDSGALAMSAAAKAIPAGAEAAAELATNPNVPKVGAAIGRAVGAVAPAIAGGVEGGPTGAAIGLAAASKGAWAGGKTGWFSGKLAQSAAAPVAAALEKVAPYAQALSTASGAQGALDLAQMADPKRQDIGVMGVGPSVHIAGEHPALGNLVIGKVIAAVTDLMKQGMTQAEAVRSVLAKSK